MIDLIFDMTQSKYNYHHEGVHNIIKMSVVKTERRCAKFCSEVFMKDGGLQIKEAITSFRVEKEWWYPRNYFPV